MEGDRHLNSQTQRFIPRLSVLQGISAQSDGRCDTAMLMLKDVFNRVWGALAGEMRAEFWDVAIAEVRKVAPGFLFVAEAYWVPTGICNKLDLTSRMITNFTTTLRRDKGCESAPHSRVGMHAQHPSFHGK